MKRFQSGQKYIDSIYFFHPNGQVAYSDNYGYGRSEMMYRKNTIWEKKVQGRDGKVYWISSFEFPAAIGKTIRPYNFSYGRIIKDIYSKFQDIGVIVVNINTKLLGDICESVEVSNHGLIVIIDENGNVIWHENSNWIGRDISTHEFFGNIGNNTKEIFEKPIDGKEYIIIGTYSYYNN